MVEKMTKTKSPDVLIKVFRISSSSLFLLSDIQHKSSAAAPWVCADQNVNDRDLSVVLLSEMGNKMQEAEDFYSVHTSSFIKDHRLE